MYLPTIWETIDFPNRSIHICSERVGTMEIEELHIVCAIDELDTLRRRMAIIVESNGVESNACPG